MGTWLCIYWNVWVLFGSQSLCCVFPENSWKYKTALNWIYRKRRCAQSANAHSTNTLDIKCQVTSVTLNAVCGAYRASGEHIKRHCTLCAHIKFATLASVNSYWGWTRLFAVLDRGIKVYRKQNLNNGTNANLLLVIPSRQSQALSNLHPIFHWGYIG